MRLVYAGTPAFAVPALEALAAAGHDIPLVLTQPDRPAGRGMKLRPSAVAEAAQRLGLRVEKPTTLRSAEAQALVAQAAPDAMVVAAYGQILPPAVLAMPRHGCINIHASLLPRWRGAAPIHRAILAGDAVTGVTIMQMDAGLDTGPMLLTRERPIGPGDTTGALTEDLARLGAAAMVEVLGALDRYPPSPQDAAQATYAPKVSKEEARIDWSAPASSVDRQIRAFNPAPGAEGEVWGERIKIWRATPAQGRGSPGTVLSAGPGELVVACGEGALQLEEMQRPGGRRVDARAFLAGRSFASP